MKIFSTHASDHPRHFASGPASPLLANHIKYPQVKKALAGQADSRVNRPRFVCVFDFSMNLDPLELGISTTLCPSGRALFLFEHGVYF